MIGAHCCRCAVQAFTRSCITGLEAAILAEIDSLAISLMLPEAELELLTAHVQRPASTIMPTNLTRSDDGWRPMAAGLQQQQRAGKGGRRREPQHAPAVPPGHSGGGRPRLPRLQRCAGRLHRHRLAAGAHCPGPAGDFARAPCFFRFLFHLSTDVAAWSGDRLCESGNGLQHDAEPVSRLHTASGGCARLAAVAAAAHLPQWLFAAPAAVAVHPKSFPPCSVAGHMVAPQLWKHWLRGRSVCARSRVIGSPCQVAVQIIWPWSWCPAQQCMPERADTAVINLIGGPSRAPSDS